MQHRKPSSKVNTEESRKVLEENPASLENTDKGSEASTGSKSEASTSVITNDASPNDATSSSSADDATKDTTAKDSVSSEQSEESTPVPPKKKGGKGKADKKVSVKASSSDVSDDEAPVPTKKNVKASSSSGDEAPVPAKKGAKLPSKKTAKADSSSDDEAPVLAKKGAKLPSKKTAKADSSSDDEAPVPAKKGTKPPPSKKSVQAASSSSDDKAPVPAKKGAKPPPSKKTIKASSSSSGEESSGDEAPVPAKKGTKHPPSKTVVGKSVKKGAKASSSSDDSSGDEAPVQSKASTVGKSNKTDAKGKKPKVVVSKDSSSSGEDSPPPAKKTVAPAFQTNDNELVEEFSTGSTLFVLRDALFPAIKATLERIGCKEWHESHGHNLDELTEEILNYQVTKTQKKAPASCKFSVELLRKVASGKYKHNFPTDPKEKVCLAHCSHNANQGQDPFSCCRVKTTTGKVCAKHLKNAAGKKLDELTKKKGFSLDEYVKSVLAAAAVWANNKLKELTKVPNGKITVQKPSSNSSASSSDNESVSSDEEKDSVKGPKLVPYKHSKDKSMWHAETGAVLVEVKGKPMKCVGIDKNNTGKKLKVPAKTESIIKKLGWTIDPKAASDK
jgi:hypothetical protein